MGFSIKQQIDAMMKFNIIIAKKIRTLFIIILALLVYIPVNAGDFIVDGLIYNIISNDQVEVTFRNSYETSYTNYSGNVQIPENVVYNEIVYHVTSIGDRAFDGCADLSTIIVPNSVTQIGNSAFRNCSGLTTIDIPNSVISIGDWAFYGCSLTGQLTIPSSVFSIGEYAFYECSGLTGPLTIPNSVTFIGDCAFANCSGLSGPLTIPNSITDIGGGAFLGCRSLSGPLTLPNSLTSIGNNLFDGCSGFTGSLTIPNSVTSIGNHAFSSCSGFTGSLTIPNSVTSIGGYAFQNCGGLTTLIIPNSVSNIGDGAFEDCSNLEHVYSSLISPYDINWTFGGISRNAILHIPKGTKSVYQQYSGWTNYFSQIVDDLYNPDQPVTTYSLSVKAVGYGSVLYNEETTREGENTYILDEGTSVTILFSPDNGYRIKSLRVNGSDVTTSTSYTTTINSNTSIVVEFEAIPPTTYILSIKATGNGSASYGGESVRGTTKSFTVNEGTSVTISFTPDNGYRIKSLKVNGSNVTASISYTTAISANTSIEVEFEAIPPTTYTLSIKATGNGSASYGGESVRGTTKSYTVNEGTSATISFSPDNGYRIKSLKVNGSNVTASISYTTAISANTSIEVEFEAIPPTTYTLSIKATGNGSASYSGTSIKGKTSTFTVNEGTIATITFSPDTGYRIKSLKVNSKDVTSSVSSDKYTVTVNSDTSVEVVFEAIPATTYTLSIKATGNGSASYDGTTIKGKTSTFPVNEGTYVTITFTSEDGYRIKSLKVNGTAVTATNSYTFTVNKDVSVEVVFEAIPITTYTLSIKATGNGSASYSGESIRNTTKSYSLNSGTTAIITFTPDNGYRIKDVEVNEKSVNLSSNNSYTLTINTNTTVEVEYEEIPSTLTSYTLTIVSSGNGTATYEGETIRQSSKSYTIDEGTYATITFTPDEGYRIKDVEVNGASISLNNNSYSFKMNKDITVDVEFEELPSMTYNLSISATGNGYVIYNGESIRETTQSYTIYEGSNVDLSFNPDNDKKLLSVLINGESVDVISDSYTISNVNSDVNVVVTFEGAVNYDIITIDGINYQVISYDDHLLKLDGCDDELTLEVPETINYQGEEWSIIGITNDALMANESIAAIIWNPEVLFNAKVSNPNLLLYVKDENYAPSSIKNVVVNGYAKSISLTDAQTGNNFHCPVSFTAGSVVYSHSYSMKTGMNESRGWETLALPFDVQEFSHSSRGEIIPFAKWSEGSDMKPFWLYELSGDGFVEAEEVKAYTPYIISMPNNELYENEYKLSGRVTFSSKNVEISNSEDYLTQTYGGKTFIPNYIEKQANEGYYALNVNNDYAINEGGSNEGSKFILNLRKIHPFEAYMTSASNARAFEVFEDMKTVIRGIEEIAISQKKVKVYDLSGKLLKVDTSLEAIKQELPAGVYIVNNQKIMVK